MFSKHSLVLHNGKLLLELLGGRVNVLTVKVPLHGVLFSHLCMCVGYPRVSNISAEALGDGAVYIRWIPQYPFTSRGYRVTMTPGRITRVTTDTYTRVTLSRPILYTIEVITLSQHYSSAASTEVDFRCKE